MKPDFRVKAAEDKFFPVSAFFNGISDEDFIDTVDHLTRGIGASPEKAHCFFPGDLDEYEIAQLGGKAPEAIEFSMEWGEEVYVDIPTFRRFLEMACDAYIRDHPEDKVKIEELLERPPPPLTPPETNVVA